MLVTAAANPTTLGAPSSLSGSLPSSRSAAIAAAIALSSSHKSSNASATTTSVAPTSSTRATTTTTGAPATTTTTTTVALPPNSAVTVDVLNASGTAGLAAQTAANLKAAGFGISGIGNASSNIAAGSPSQIYYGPAGLAGAQALAKALSGSVSLVPNSTLGGNNLILWIANAQLTVATTTTTA